MLLSNFNTGFKSSGNIARLMTGGYQAYASLQYITGASSDGHYGGNTTACGCVVIGAGDTPVTKGDYDLADSSIMASDKMASSSHSVNYTKLSGAIVCDHWTNNSNEPITVKEIGLTNKISTPAYNKGSNILIARKVLTTPVTVQPGETYAFTYNIKI